MKRIDLTDKRIGGLTVIRPLSLSSYRQLKWECRCDCGNVVNVAGVSLRNGDTKSCGCYRRDVSRKRQTKHGAYDGRTKRERLYNIYSDMRQRCLDPNSAAYKYYGGRGITICNEWLDSYVAFRSWALSNGYSDSLSIDRINNDGNYEPSNCRWADAFTQARNKRMGRTPNRCAATGRFLSDRRA